MSYTAKQIAAMIRANVKAVDEGKITWEQFGRVNGATWDLASGGQPPVIGSPEARFVSAVHKALAEPESHHDWRDHPGDLKRDPREIPPAYLDDDARRVGRI